MTKRKKYQVAAWVLVILAALIILAVSGFFVMTRIGKARLQKNATSQMPVLSENPEDGQPAEVLEPDDTWEDDWIRYQGGVYDYNENIITFLCMGIDVDDQVDKSQKGLNSGQADALFLLVLNPDSKKMSIIAIDRNTMTEIDTYDKNNQYVSTQLGQIALAHGYGDGREGSAENTMKSVSGLMYDLPIHGYCAVNMAAISDINDAVGGVDVTVLEDLTKANKVFVKDSQVHLEGKLAYLYVKYRDISVEGSARLRLNRQKQYLINYVGQAKEALKADMTLPITLFNKILPYMTTNITVDEVAYLAGTVAGYSFSEEDLIMVPGNTDTSGRFDEFYPDEEQLKQIIVDVFYTPVEDAG